jgi:hypothetical protein
MASTLLEWHRRDREDRRNAECCRTLPIPRLFGVHHAVGSVAAAWRPSSIQDAQFWMGADFRWNQTPWDDHWINIEVPARLKSQPNLFLTMGGAQTNSLIASHLDSLLLIWILAPDWSISPAFTLGPAEPMGPVYRHRSIDMLPTFACS